MFERNVKYKSRERAASLLMITAAQTGKKVQGLLLYDPLV